MLHEALHLLLYETRTRWQVRGSRRGRDVWFFRRWSEACSRDPYVPGDCERRNKQDEEADDRDHEEGVHAEVSIPSGCMGRKEIWLRVQRSYGILIPIFAERIRSRFAFAGETDFY